MTEDEISELLRKSESAERQEYVQDELEETLVEEEPERVCETDKAWDAIHRSLTDGSLAVDRDDSPAAAAVLAGESLNDSDDYLMSLKSPVLVEEISDFLKSVSREALRAGYDQIDPEDYDGQLGDEDFEYTWDWFESLVKFYELASQNEHHVLFTADQ